MLVRFHETHVNLKHKCWVDINIGSLPSVPKAMETCMISFLLPSTFFLSPNVPNLAGPLSPRIFCVCLPPSLRKVLRKDQLNPFLQKCSHVLKFRGHFVNANEKMIKSFGKHQTFHTDLLSTNSMIRESPKGLNTQKSFMVLGMDMPWLIRIYKWLTMSCHIYQICSDTTCVASSWAEPTCLEEMSGVVNVELK